MSLLPPFIASHVRPRKGFRSAYLETYESGVLAENVEEALEALRSCRVCPRDCDVDRLADERAVCKTGRHARVASAFPHFGEEDCLRGWNGSGTIFFSQCNLRCVFCQNFDISWQGEGEELTAREIAALAIRLQDQGCHNLSFVTPEHAREVIREMHRQVGELTCDEDGLALRCLLVRHLVMPEGLSGSREIFRFLAEKLSADTYLNVMDQYYPAGQVTARPERYAEIGRGTSQTEVLEAVQLARRAGLHRLDERWRRPRGLAQFG